MKQLTYMQFLTHKNSRAHGGVEVLDCLTLLDWTPTKKTMRTLVAWSTTNLTAHTTDSTLLHALRRGMAGVFDASLGAVSSLRNALRMVKESLISGVGKVCGQKTSDGRYALIYNPGPKRRWPLAMLTRDGGISFRNPNAVHGALPERCCDGFCKDSGANYHRCLCKWNNDGSWKDDALLLVYRMNKEEIRVIREPVAAPPKQSPSLPGFSDRMANSK